MKKFFSILSIMLLTGSLFFSSCTSSHRLCPAYQPSTRDASINQNIGNANETAQSVSTQGNINEF